VTIPFTVRALPSAAFQAWLTPPPLGAATARMDRDALRALSRCHLGGLPGHETGTGPIAIALHGWGGRPGQMVSIARRLADEGYHTVVPELPGHAGGPKTDIKEAAAALRGLIEEVGEPEVIVAHSFAAMVIRLAYPESGPARVVLVAPALNVEDLLEVFGDRLELLPWVRRGLHDRLRSWDTSLWPIVSQMMPQQLEGTEMTIIHDPHDKETPFAGSAELAAMRPATSIFPLEGAGHSRVLSNPIALDYITAFVRGEPVRSESAA
jgi:pimeloyl-ACP methyl ester carboxylesterase